MQELINREFLDLSEDRSFPLDEMATKVSDQGSSLPADILADLRLTLDPTLGQSVFVTSVVVSDELINVTLAVTDALQSKPNSFSQEVYGDDVYEDPYGSPYFNAAQDEDFLSNTSPTFAGTSALSPIIPIAVITASISDAIRGLPIRVEPLVGGVGGWAIFGRELSQHVSNTWSFSNVTQSAVSRRSVHFLNFTRVTTLGRYGEQNTVDGVVTIDGENDLEVSQTDATTVCFTEDCGTSDTRDTINIGFAGDRLKDNLKKYIGPCGGRPDAASCFRGEPIMAINGVKPVPAAGAGDDPTPYDNALFLIFPEDLVPSVFAWHQLGDEAGNSVINLTQDVAGLAGNSTIANTYESSTDIYYDSEFTGGDVNLYASAVIKVIPSVDPTNLNGKTFTITNTAGTSTVFTYDTSSSATGLTIGLSGLTTPQNIADKISDSVDSVSDTKYISSTTDSDVGLAIRSDALSISTVCGPPLPEVGDDGTIGSGSCCDDCEEDCVEGVNATNTIRSLQEEIASGVSTAHICLGTDILAIHEYNHTLATTRRTYLTFVGSLGENYVYAENTADLSSGFVAYISAVEGIFRLNEDGVRLEGIMGRMRSDACASDNITYNTIVGSETQTVTLTAAHKSIFGTVASALHTPIVDMQAVGATLPDPSDYYCENIYGRYISSVSYELDITPYADPLNIGENKYPYTLYYTPSTGTKSEVMSGYMFVTSEAEDNSSGSPKPTPRLETGDVTFTYQGDTYSGTIYSDLESLGGC